MEKFNDQLYASKDLEKQLKYLNLLSDKFPNVQSASSEVINLSAILNLPKGTEHFLTDIHGEYETFSHVLANASGVVKRKIDDVFGKTLRQKEKNALATLIYYPKEKLGYILKNEEDPNEWFSITLQRLAQVARAAASKYTRSKVRKAMPKDFAYIIDELLNESGEDKEEYFEAILNTIINIDRAESFIVAICKFIQRLLIDRLHIIGDIFDRGPYADKVMDRLIDYHSVDIQWGNHDIIWMGAASGNLALIANVIRISLRYNNLDTLEDAYGINMLPLATFAMEQYKNDPCDRFHPKADIEGKELELLRQMHKAIAIIQLKLEGQTVQRNPHFNMNDRLLLDKIDLKNGKVSIGDKKYDLLDKNFPTINSSDPHRLSKGEQEVMDRLRASFRNSKRLQQHIEFLYTHGSMYLTYNSNLLYHGCIPMNAQGEFESFEIEGKSYKGKELCDHFERVARKGYYHPSASHGNEHLLDYSWYLWCGPLSPLFGKQRMTTFERYFVADKTTYTEKRNPYYSLAFEEEKYCNLILKEFGLEPKYSHIVNGHVPVKVKKGESPIKANGKLFVIDGGMSIPYQAVTGVSGYTLIYNSFGLVLVEHNAFDSKQTAIEKEKDIISNRIFIEKNANRKRVNDTDVGKEIQSQIDDLKMLLAAYRKGVIKERM
ncbi:MAG: fructose-1,6-bisphosphatase [Bacteroidales bacterium]|nr:fructose-1,6-bisphosphatase [Bacteroidales bacterium]